MAGTAPQTAAMGRVAEALDALVQRTVLATLCAALGVASRLATPQHPALTIPSLMTLQDQTAAAYASVGSALRQPGLVMAMAAAANGLIPGFGYEDVQAVLCAYTTA